MNGAKKQKKGAGYPIYRPGVDYPHIEQDALPEFLNSVAPPFEDSSATDTTQHETRPGGFTSRNKPVV